jgi:acyl carrier protein
VIAPMPVAVAPFAPEIEARIRRFFREQINVEVPSADTDLFESGALDSLALVALLVVLEEELGRRISLEQIEISDFQSIAQIVRVFAPSGTGS